MASYYEALLLGCILATTLDLSEGTSTEEELNTILIYKDDADVQAMYNHKMDELLETLLDDESEVTDTGVNANGGFVASGDIADDEDAGHGEIAQGVRLARATCDLLSATIMGNSLGHAACAAHCIAMNRGFHGGRCMEGVCHCRK